MVTDNREPDGCIAVCKSCKNKQSSEWRFKRRAANLELYKKREKEQREKHKEKHRESTKKYKEKNREKLQAHAKIKYNEKYKFERKQNRDILNSKQREYRKDRMKTDPCFKIACSCRIKINKMIRRSMADKHGTMNELIGCSDQDLKIYLQSLFTQGMNWENYGVNGWHIDHIIPCAAFDLTKPEEQKACFHYSNLQPLWALDNLKKGAKIL